MSERPSIHLVKMPKWGLSMQEGTITRWHVGPGDFIAEGEPLCDVETAKITNEFEAPASGIVARLLATPEDIVPIGQPIAVLAEEGTDPAEIDAAVAASRQASVEKETASAPALRWVEVGASSLAYLEAGAGIAGEAVVFLHGFGGDHDNWVLNQGVLAEHHRTVAFDLPGHGASGKAVGDGTAADLASRIQAALQALEFGRMHLVAHSFGGLVALLVIELGGSDIASLTLIAPLGLGVPANADYIRGFVAAERKRDLKPVMEMLFADPSLLGRSMVNDALSVLRDEPTRAVLRRMGETLLASQPTAEAIPRLLAGLRHQVIWGDRDGITPLDPTLANRLGDRLHIVENAGHMPHLEKAATVNALIGRFIGD